MSDIRLPDAVRLIPVDRIQVLNHRERNSRTFEEISRNIGAIGLKKPITVTPRTGSDGEYYLLVCGEGRLNAFRALKQRCIPAMVVSASDEDAFIMSLAENIARRKYRPLELLNSIGTMQSRGYDARAIAQKTGLTTEYVQGILSLLQHGEERLLIAVQKGQIPLNAAMTIVGKGDDDAGVQTALQQAYESGELRGRQLTQARRVLKHRLTFGPAITRGASRRRATLTGSSLVRTYRREVERQRVLVRKAEFAQQRLLFVASALKQLFTDENFVNLLRAEGLDTLPRYLAERVLTPGEMM